MLRTENCSIWRNIGIVAGLILLVGSLGYLFGYNAGYKDGVIDLTMEGLKAFQYAENIHIDIDEERLTGAVFDELERLNLSDQILGEEVPE